MTERKITSARTGEQWTVEDRRPTELRIDPDRFARINTKTGIYVRATNGVVVSSFDIVHLDAASLLSWLRSRGGKNEFAENTVGMLLGHKEIIAP